MFRGIDVFCERLRQARCGRFVRFSTICLCVFMAAHHAAAAVNVVVWQPSSPHPRVSIHFEGKPIAGAKVEIYRDQRSSQAVFTAVSSMDGSTEVPKLKPGKYQFLVFADPKLVGYLYLQVSSLAGDDTSKFIIDLECCAPPTFEEMVASAEQTTPQSCLDNFRGLIHDQSGAPIPKVDIDVVSQGTKGEAHAAKLRSSPDGTFSSHLQDGRYVAIFRSQGFSIRLIPFAISQQCGNGELPVTLKIGPSS